MKRDLRLAYKLWRITRTDFAWQAVTDLIYSEAAKRVRKQSDEVKRKKLVFIEAMSILHELEDTQ